ncbi:hypothetical protein GGTG_10138 [Gaeumannomyces tritici R3-111a-1]|uniref:Uncharacterized protein n=1 Tax=Gaeumannomyces tritici (strain R3-111a-1) TaxID=644352 RepID=J3P9F7_GAET3|nr:hypothetical protein GGTG_10138 [Gaeumannomyces tritici R3-111a-1]EJT73293.1 hypothetical protein GGTG_10138 [Gaeumannomyces tritici R3-111a-1]
MKLRHMLQVAVCARVRDHEMPLAGLSRDMAAVPCGGGGDGGAGQEEDEQHQQQHPMRGVWQEMLHATQDHGRWLAAVAETYHYAYSAGSVEADADVRALTGALLGGGGGGDQQPGQGHGGGGGLAATEEERKLFLLEAEDVRALRLALDAQEAHGQRKWRPAAEYARAFARTPVGAALLAPGSGRKGEEEEEEAAMTAAATATTVGPSPLQQHQVQQQGHRRGRGGSDAVVGFAPAPAFVQPPNHGALTSWKRSCLLADLRERAVRERLRYRGEGDRLFDIPRGDPEPRHLMASRVTGAQREIVCGVVCPPGWPPLPDRFRG